MSQSIIRVLVRPRTVSLAAVIATLAPPSIRFRMLAPQHASVSEFSPWARQPIERRGIVPENLPCHDLWHLGHQAIHRACAMPVRKIARVHEDVIRPDVVEHLRNPDRLGGTVQGLRGHADMLSN